MSDTARSKADILALFADNSTNLISEQDLRDYVESVLGGYGSIMMTGASTSQTVSDTAQKMTGWLSDGLATGVVPDYASNEIAVDVAGTYRVEVNIGFTGSSGDTFCVSIFDDSSGSYASSGLPEGKHEAEGSSDVETVHTFGDVSLSAGDKVCIYVFSTTGGTVFTPEEGTLSVKRIG